MTWIVYKRTNTLNSKVYVGVTSRTLMERWQIELDVAEQIKRSILEYERLLQDKKACKTPEAREKRLKRQEKKLKRLKTTMAYDVFMNAATPEIWLHETLEEHNDNVVGALLAEKRFIKAFHSNDPMYGYNRSEGGEFPPWINVDDVIRLCKPYCDMMQ